MRILRAIAWCLLSLPAAAMFTSEPQDVPLSRLEANVQRYLSAHPDDGQAHYILGRLYAIAYATRSEQILAASEGSADKLPSTDRGDSDGGNFMRPASQEAREEVRKHFNDPPAKLSAEDEARVTRLIAALDSDDYGTREKAQADLSAMGEKVIAALKKAQEGGKLTSEQKSRVGTTVEALEKGRLSIWALKKAIVEYETAVEKSKDPALALLALGWCREEAGQGDKAIEAYRKAYATAAQGEMAREDWSHYLGSWHGCVGLEAGTRLLALLPKDDAQRGEIAKGVETLNARVAHAGGFVTPIVVPLYGEEGLHALLDPTRIVPFDLIGDGHSRRWPWVRPTTGILVWDPRGSASIRRGQQLFGSITWYIPWRHGYEPLAWLDDDGDGRLEGAELRGLALWCDRDQDGVSTPDEVRPLDAWGIRSLGFDASFDAKGPWCTRGVEFTDGRVAHTYDWLPRSVPEK